MNARPLFILLLLPTIAFAAGHEADENISERDSLKIAALEALMSAPPEKALPLVDKVLAGNHSTEVKERALFILSQIDSDEAQATLLRFAREDNSELQLEAIRMIGIGGDDDTLASLGEVYRSGNSDVKDAVLEAYLIADDSRAIYELAVNADNEEDFSNAVDMLGAMGASAELRELRGQAGVSESLIDAYAVSGDADSLRELAMDGSDPELQKKAIEALGIVGGEDVDSTLVQIYRGADSDDVREAALTGMLISGHDSGVLELYRGATRPAEKRQLLEYLVMMDSDAIYDVIDQTLAEDQ